MALPTNRGFVPLRRPSAVAPLPSRVQVENFGTRTADAPAQGRPAAPRPALTSLPTQSREVFTAEKLDPEATARALNALQARIAESTAQSRANPFASGQLFQNVPLVSTLAKGTTAQRPAAGGLPEGFVYFDETLEVPLWLFGGDWVESDSTVIAAASTADMATTDINHGFGTPAVGVLVANVRDAVIHNVPQLVLSNDATDNTIARIWFSYTPLSASPAADFYLYR